MPTIPSDGRPPSLDANALTSLWDGLSPHLIATFYEVARIGDNGWGRVQGKTDSVVVMAPLTEANMEIALNWQSPFEQAGPESKAPTLLAMLQSGALQPIVDSVMGKPKEGGAQQKSNEFLSQFEGRTGITKLNSTQVFNGMPPVKIQVTALLRAWRDTAGEVEAPFNKLMEWALPIELSQDGSVLARAAETAKGEMGYVEALMPSKSPTRIAMKYKGRIYSPLVIESIGMPMSSPVDKSGRYVELAVPMTLCTLTAIDRKDWSGSVSQI
jgi:hypothetical protein